MQRVTKTFTETLEYDEFDPGDIVEPMRFNGPLPPGRYIVTEFVGPYSVADEPTVFVEGHPYGMNGHHFRLATEQAIEVPS